ncbi:MAG TPA: META domain-containing protein [Anaerolineales bacterium]|nr:META domain-containing protein [Anaerolineales bacterium]
MKLATLPALIFLALAMFVFNACSNTGTTLTGEWKLISYGDATNTTPAIADSETSITFNEGKFGGTVGCNTFGADYTSEGSNIHIGSVVSTMMFCESTSAQESAVLGILSDKTLKVSMNSNRLTLTTEDGASVVVLEKK